MEGDISTKFIAQEYPDGFTGAVFVLYEGNKGVNKMCRVGCKLTATQQTELVAAACFLHIRQLQRATEFLTVGRLVY